MMFIDISKADLHADVINNELYVELPAEMNLPNSCGHLDKACMGQGTRPSVDFSQTLNGERLLDDHDHAGARQRQG